MVRVGWEAQVHSHDGVSILETRLLDRVGGSTGSDGSVGFGVVRTHDGKRGEALAHHQPWASKHAALEDLVVELGGDDGNAGGRELNARRQEASANEA